MPVIEIYTKDYCPYCKLAKAILQRHGADYVEQSVSEDPGLFSAMVKRAAGRRTVPQIFIDGVGLGGADELSLLEESGRLDPILKGRNAAPQANDPCFRCLWH